MDTFDSIIQEAYDSAIRSGFTNHQDKIAYAVGSLAAQVFLEQDKFKRYVNKIEEQENPDYLLESISQEVRKSTTETAEDRDELVGYLKYMIKKLEKIEYDETPDEPVGDYNDMAYELEKEERLGWD